MLFLTQPTRFSTAPFCWPRPRPTQLRGEAVVERHLPEHRVPDDQLALAREDHGFGIVPDRHERHAPEGLQGMEQPADQRLLALVGDERDVDEATPLETAGKEADALDDAGDVTHAHQAEVVLAEFAGAALKADERGDGHGAEPSDQLVQRALAARVAVVLAQASDDLAAGQGPVVLQPPLDGGRPGRSQRRATHAAGADQRRGVAAAHRGFVLDPPDASHRHARLRGDRRLGHSDCAQDLDFMPGHGSDHSSPFPGKRLAAASPGWSVTSEPVWTGQNFRKGSGQNFRNPHTPEPEDRQFACVAAGGSFNLASVMLRRLVGLFLAAAILALAPAAQASPPDQSWISGLYDNADFDDVVLLITSNFGAVELDIVWSLRPVARVIGLVMPMEREHQAVCPLSSVLGRAPPLA